jgi:hypothetical protein
MKGMTKAVSVGARNTMAFTAAADGTFLIALFSISSQKKTRY